MRQLPKPTLKDDDGNVMVVADVFRLCLKSVQNRTLRARFQAIIPLIEEAAEEYDDAADRGTLHDIVREALVGGGVTNQELSDLYTLRMAKGDRAGRPVYDKILAAAKDVCPLCGVGEADSLDHHLPKGEYSRLTTTPNNLVPACGRCQDNKWEAFPTNAGEQTIHPYFDDFVSDQWLTAEVKHTAPATFHFFVTAPTHWGAVKADRARRHMKILDLSLLYSINAGNELTSRRKRWAKLLQTGNADSVRAHLIEEGQSCREAELNSWQTAFYVAAANDAWFYSGGFAHI
jgi:hypothetical protein